MQVVNRGPNAGIGSDSDLRGRVWNVRIGGNPRQEPESPILAAHRGTGRRELRRLIPQQRKSDALNSGVEVTTDALRSDLICRFVTVDRALAATLSPDRGQFG